MHTTALYSAFGSLNSVWIFLHLQMFACAAEVKANVGSVNILVNNAGTMDYCKMIDCQLDSWVKMVELNCIGFLNATAAILPHMKSASSGHIVNITSDAGRKVTITSPARRCTKTWTDRHLPLLNNVRDSNLYTFQPFAGLAVYSGTKYFAECVSEAMRQEVVPNNIKVTCIQPGDTTTELHAKTMNPEVR